MKKTTTMGLVGINMESFIKNSLEMIQEVLDRIILPTNYSFSVSNDNEDFRVVKSISIEEIKSIIEEELLTSTIQNLKATDGREDISVYIEHMNLKGLPNIIGKVEIGILNQQKGSYTATGLYKETFYVVNLKQLKIDYIEQMKKLDLTTDEISWFDTFYNQSSILNMRFEKAIEYLKNDLIELYSESDIDEYTSALKTHSLVLENPVLTIFKDKITFNNQIDYFIVSLFNKEVIKVINKTGEVIIL